MARTSMVVAAVILVLGLISVGAGFAAELTRAKVCVDRNSLAMGLAITAAVALLLLRIVVRVATGRGYACCRTDPNVPKLIRYCIILAWLMSFLAVGQFVLGAKLCYKCGTLKPGLFSTAAFEALANLCLTLFYYLVIASTQNAETIKPPAEVETPEVANNSTTALTSTTCNDV